MSETIATPVTPRQFSEPCLLPTQKGPMGILYDFNRGCRIQVPRVMNKLWKVRISDVFTNNILFEHECKEGAVESTKKYFVPFKLECYLDGELVLEHQMDLKGKPVLIQYPVGTLGDVIAWFSYADLFQKKHQCELICVMADSISPLFKGENYPNIQFLSLEEADLIQKNMYATYKMGLFFEDVDNYNQPVDFRYVGLHRTAAHILGVPADDIPPKLNLGEFTRSIEEPYVCIAVQSSTQCKYWNNPLGWYEIIKWLKSNGYRVLCIDKAAAWGTGSPWNVIPNGAEDFTGDIPLLERARLLHHAEFFIGLSSGLAWLSWSVGIPTVMISGFTHPNNEFETPYRVFNHHVCNSCWNDPKIMFDHSDFNWCPRHKGTPREFECTRLITVDHVKSVVKTIPIFEDKSAAKK
jgi:autotransporter strand-loop-strand O-heptosyltransferase